MFELDAQQVLHVRPFLSVTTGIVVLFVGKALNQRFALLREYNIPEPVTAGLLFAVACSSRCVSASGLCDAATTRRWYGRVHRFRTRRDADRHGQHDRRNPGLRTLAARVPDRAARRTTVARCTARSCVYLLYDGIRGERQ